MSITRERFQYFLDKLTMQKKLADAKLSYFLSNPEGYAELLELDEQIDAINREIIEDSEKEYRHILDSDLKRIEYEALRDSEE